MNWNWSFAVIWLFWLPISLALPYLEDQTSWNLNQNLTATNPLNYWGQWEDHEFQTSPDNWRMPFYTITLDRFVNGDPTNDDANGTQWEHDPTSNQFRFGGDLQGLIGTFDYLQGMGIKALYLAGSPMVNMPWASDGYSPLDLTLLDAHHGIISDWRDMVTELHRRGMYVILDNTMATMGDLMGFEGYLNDTSGTPFSFDEHEFVWKTTRRYWDFDPGNDYNETCDYPQFWYDTGVEIGTNVTSHLVGCMNSEFNQYGEVNAFLVYPDWQRQISKFAYVQDRLREWIPSVRAKIERFSCITIAMLDIDGFRIDKGLTITVDAQAAWSSSIRECARSLNKTNFLIAGEVVDGNTFGAIYYGRGTVETTEYTNLTKAVMATSTTNNSDLTFIRDYGNSALDSASFHYSIYRGLTVFLGLDGEIGAVGDTSYNFVEAWHQIVATNDLVNANTGVFDPRHLFGVTNQDVFRWPSLTNGTQRQLMGNFITMLLMPGIPLMVWGEEQAFYVLDSQAENYVFGRNPMASNQAWQMHGCYKLGEVWYTDMPWGDALTGCNDDSISLDHRDASHPVRNIHKRMFQLRESFPVLNDGYVLEQLSNQTHDILFRGSGNRSSEFGVWSTLRSRTEGVQDFTGDNQGNQSVWLIYTNENSTIDYTFNCSSDTLAMISPFPYTTTVKNLFYPYEELNMTASTQKLGFEGSDEFNGCIEELSLRPWEYKAFVPIDQFVEPNPVITRVLPGHDSRLTSTVALGEQEVVPIEVHFSANMSCDDVTSSLTFNSTTQDGQVVALNKSSVVCLAVDADEQLYVGGIPTAWIFKANLTNVSNGIHTFTVNNATSSANLSTNAVDHFMFRIGQPENIVVFPKNNASVSILHKDSSTGDLYIVSNSPGADKFRYSLNWGSTYSSWSSYNSSNFTLTPQSWSGTSAQKWKGEHVIVQYWSQLAGSADHYKHSELSGENLNIHARRFPHIFTQGAWNEYALDSGLPNTMKLERDNLWTFNHMAEWPSTVAFNIWGVNPDRKADQSIVFGDIDGDGILDRVPPVTLLSNNVSLPEPPAMPHLSWRLTFDDSTLGYTVVPAGHAWHQLAMWILMALIPPITGVTAIILFRKSFYGVKHNEVGVPDEVHMFEPLTAYLAGFSTALAVWKAKRKGVAVGPAFTTEDALAGDVGAPNRRKVLIATMEYEIEDWSVKIKIGGLGVMASLMGKNLGHQDLIWVVPCVGGIEYPLDQVAEPMTVTVLGNTYEIKAQYHVVRNITYVLLDAPVFRAQTKSEPYPPRMDDVDSAIYYSAWNQCIAETMRRFNPDIYHINDYHGTVAPLHLLPRTIPVCLSLHNAEFQGLWPMRTVGEIEEVCSIYNLTPEVAKKYVQFGEVFNLLHAGASYLRVHQKGFGAVGVSKKYGVRSFARYSIFWGLSKVGALPNPDPSDQDAYDKNEKQAVNIVVNREAEAARGALRVQAQEWAGLKQDPNAELFVFVGRWSMQKGVDLIADVFPSVLEKNPNAQLLCVGPVIDLYGKFAAMKLDTMMTKYPGRVCSKPVFTMLPPFVFSGAEFALIPSRDEPFGLVAVEFGRKGALGVGARVGGLGQMPGWWFTIESTTTKHLMKQFKMAIQDALSSKTEVREQMRARSALQRFPVAQWVEDLGILQSKSIELHQKYSADTTGGFEKLPDYDTEPLGPSAADELNLTWTPRNDPDSASVYSQQSVLSRIVDSSWFGPGPKRPETLMGMEDRKKYDLAQALRTAAGGVVNHGGNSNSVSGISTRAPSSRNSPMQSRRSSIGASQNPKSSGRSTKGKAPSGGFLSAISQRMSDRISPGRISPGRVMFEMGDDDDEEDVVNNTHHHTNSNSSARSNGSTSPRPGLTSIPLQNLHEGEVSQNEQSENPRSRSNSRSRDTSPRPSRVASRSLIPQSSLREVHQEDDISEVDPFADPRSIRSTPLHTRTNSRVTIQQPSLRELQEDEDTNPFSEPISAWQPPRASYAPSRTNSVLSLDTVVGERTDFKLQAVDPFFIDSTGLYAGNFQTMLKSLDGKSSEDQLCIEDYLKKSEKQWYNRFHDAKLGKGSPSPATPATSVFRMPWSNKSAAASLYDVGETSLQTPDLANFEYNDINQFGLREDHVAPTGVRRLMLQKVGDWPVYAFLLAFGQIIAANSYQVTLLIGQNGEEASELYTVASIYLAASAVWWVLLRHVKTVYVLSIPFIFYGFAFFFVGMVPYVVGSVGKAWMQNVATALYAIASASGSIFFAQNFGSEGGAAVDSWAFRACVIQGTQQIYVSALWYWGSSLSKQISNGVATSSLVSSKPVITAICAPIAIFLWCVGALIFLGLPNFYRQKPGTVPSFYRAICRRKIVGWFIVMVILQNYWMSAPTGRNWTYLWSSAAAPAWAVLLLAIFFFIIVWALFLWLFGHLSKSDSWIIPVFAIGLGAPRWCQMLWGISNIGLYVPWAGGPVASALAGRALWLWLGVLDAVQGVGFGMILLQTLTRLHVTFTLILAQMIGSLATIAARASAPNKIGPGTVFPDFSGGAYREGFSESSFWLGLLCQGVVCIGFFVFFRKEQLFKP